VKNQAHSVSGTLALTLLATLEPFQHEKIFFPLTVNAPLHGDKNHILSFGS